MPKTPPFCVKRIQGAILSLPFWQVFWIRQKRCNKRYLLIFVCDPTFCDWFLPKLSEIRANYKSCFFSVGLKIKYFFRGLSERLVSTIYKVLVPVRKFFGWFLSYETLKSSYFWVFLANVCLQNASTLCWRISGTPVYQILIFLLRFEFLIGSFCDWNSKIEAILPNLKIGVEFQFSSLKPNYKNDRNIFSA